MGCISMNDVNNININNERLRKVLSYLGFASKSNKIVYGKDMIKDYISDPNIRTKVIILATDAGPRVKKDLKIRCEINSIDLFELCEKSVLSKAVGMKEVAAIGVSDENLAKSIIEVLK